MTSVYFAKEFEFYGIGWDGNGAGFETALIDCSGASIQDWVFDYHEGAVRDLDGGVWDFKASGKMKGASDCYDEAALKSGGCYVGGSMT
ncbi:hypothetical protein E4T43_09227 [Aureobasidium subglaciale]|nr:hypothetical protein E4T43_09227 [Aureobasidium subglaciale]